MRGLICEVTEIVNPTYLGLTLPSVLNLTLQCGLVLAKWEGKNPFRVRRIPEAKTSGRKNVPNKNLMAVRQAQILSVETGLGLSC